LEERVRSSLEMASDALVCAGGPIVRTVLCLLAPQLFNDQLSDLNLATTSLIELRYRLILNSAAGADIVVDKRHGWLRQGFSFAILLPE
jgi:hypothetical protein